MTNEERGGGNDRPTWPNKEAEDAAKIQVLLLWGFIMDLRVFLDEVKIKNFTS